MNENNKTLLFILAAVACVALAFYTAPEARDPSVQSSKMGQALFESFDPRSATGIEIVEIDEENIESILKELEEKSKEEQKNLRKSKQQPRIPSGGKWW